MKVERTVQRMNSHDIHPVPQEPFILKQIQPSYYFESKWCSKNSSKGEVYRDTSLPQETRKMPNKQPNPTPKGTRRRRTDITQVGRRKEILNIRAEIKEIESKKKRETEKINKTKTRFFEKISKIDKPLAKLIKEIKEST